MKAYSCIVLIPFSISNCVFAQSERARQHDPPKIIFNIQSRAVTDSIILSLPYDSIGLNTFKVMNQPTFHDLMTNTSEKTNAFAIPKHQNCKTIDSLTFKRLYDSIYYGSYKPFSKETSFSTINNKLFTIYLLLKKKSYIFALAIQKY